MSKLDFYTLKLTPLALTFGPAALSFQLSALSFQWAICCALLSFSDQAVRSGLTFNQHILNRIRLLGIMRGCIKGDQNIRLITGIFNGMGHIGRQNETVGLLRRDLDVA